LTAQLIESADLVLLCGCTFSDYSTTGWTSAVDLRRLIDAKKDSVSVCGSLYSNVQLVDFISALAARVSHHDKTALSYQGYGLERPIFVSSTLTTNTLLLRDIRQAVQGSLSANTELVVDVGDLWFLSQELLLPQGSRYHAQMSYGSTGWSLGALLGIAMAVPQPGQARDLLLLIGDGAFQMAMQVYSCIIVFIVVIG
jgi:pyruvate decarboxylase